MQSYSFYDPSFCTLSPSVLSPPRSFTILLHCIHIFSATSSMGQYTSEKLSLLITPIDFKVSRHSVTVSIGSFTLCAISFAVLQDVSASLTILRSSKVAIISQVLNRYSH